MTVTGGNQFGGSVVAFLRLSTAASPTTMVEAFVSVSAIFPKPSPLLPTFRRLPLLVPSWGQKRRLALSLPFYCSRDPPVAASANFTKMGRRKLTSTKEKVYRDGRSSDDDRPVCPGCGVFMQDSDPNLPGFYQKKAVCVEEEEEEEEFEVVERNGFSSKSDSEAEMLVVDNDSGETEAFEEDMAVEGKGGRGERDFDWDSDWEPWDEEKLDGFRPAGVGYGNVTEEFLGKTKKEKVSKTERKRRTREALKEQYDDATVCARCHSLRNYGMVKNEQAENLIPDFDFNRLITTSLMKPLSSSPVVVMVVDCADFDGSFPKRAAGSLFKMLEGIKRESKLKKLPRLVLVATKVDLLPSQISPTRLDRWVRNRAKANGALKLSAVYQVSARKDIGVTNLLSSVKELAGPRGNVWVIGAQNAGKSTLINAFAKKQGVKITRLTEAAVPGTTLGILRIAGVLPAKGRMYDTPGLLHPYLMSMRLSRAEQKMVEIRRQLQPRSYRVKAGQTIHVGGLVRLDLIQVSVETIYITVWASPNISLHLGKTLNADDTWTKHVGVRLQPPIGHDRASELGQWREREIKVSGNSWEVNSVDIAIAGLGWFSLGLKGEATLMLRTYDGVEVTQREPLVLDRARFLERPGFLLPKAISDAIGSLNKLEAECQKRGAKAILHC